MSVIAIDARKLTLVSLLDDARAPILGQLLGTPAFRGATHVPVAGATLAQRNLLGARIDAAIAQADRAVMLVAQGTGCMVAAWWARLSPVDYVSRVAGAVMITPDTAGTGDARFASPRCTLPFPSIVVGADDATQRLASEWGSRLIDGPIPIAQPARSNRFHAMIDRFTAAIVERDAQAAERLLQAIGDR